MKPSPSSRIRIPESAVEELDQVEQFDWTEGIPIEDLLAWLNEVTARFRPDEIDGSARSSQEFSPRTFRHYQTLGCIDPPVRSGRRARYGFRHYLQGLLLRKLLWERVSSEQIAAMMPGRSNEDYKRLLFEGIEIVPRGGGDDRPGGREEAGEPQWWKRIPVAPGVELQLQSDRPQMNPAEINGVLARIREALLRE